MERQKRNAKEDHTRALLLTEVNIMESKVQAAMGALQDAVNAMFEAQERIKEIRKEL